MIKIVKGGEKMSDVRKNIGRENELSDTELKNDPIENISQELSTEDEIVGKRFEELSEETMNIIQGSGSDVYPENIWKSVTLLTSEAPYHCRG